MKQQTLPTSIEYGKLLKEKVEKGKINHVNYYGLRDDFDTKIMRTPMLCDLIPCVEENGVWKPIEEPKGYAEWISEYNRGFEHDYEGLIHKQYKTALSKVLFSGWEVESITENSIYLINIEQDKKFIFDLKSGLMKEFYGKSTLNDLTSLNLPLTETGVIEFNLKF